MNQGGSSSIVLVGDHAGHAIPQKLGTLGLDPASLDLHIASDIGVSGLGRHLSEQLDACFISQTYSRLVIDCNRKPGDPTSICTASDGIEIPGNLRLSADARQARQRYILQPYHEAIAAELNHRASRGRRTLLVSLHSFTPVMNAFERPWKFGVLHRHDSALSSRVLAGLRTELGSIVGDNEPYAMDDKDYTVPLHADPRALDYLELEVRQDLLADDAGQMSVASFIARLLN